jgi:hypothetical protein
MVVRARAGVQVYEWKGGEWQIVSMSDIFSDESGFSQPERYRTVQIFTDARSTGGAAWLIGLEVGRNGPSSAAIAIYPWSGGNKPGLGGPTTC